MASSPNSAGRSNANVRRLLRSVRWRIRWLVFLEGIALVFACFVILFWGALCADYLPVKFGFQELSQTARTVILVLSGLVLATVLYSKVLKRIFVSLHDRSMALLVEKKNPQFAESLITTVEFDSGNLSSHKHPSLLEISREKANRLAGEVAASTVLNDRHVRRSMWVAAAGMLSLVAFAVTGPAALQTALERLYLLDQKQWTRESQLEWVALKTEYESPVPGIPEFDQPVAATHTDPAQPVTFLVAKGATLNLTVKARSSQPAIDNGPDQSPPKKLPRSCQLHFETEDENYGSQTLNKVGAVRERWQLYRLQGAPLAAINSDLSFTVLGGDCRMGPYRISVVESPIVTATVLECAYPKYMQDENSLRGSAREIPWVGKTELPYGTRVNVRVQCNKPLMKVYVIDNRSSEAPDQGQQNYPLATVTDSGFEFSVEELFQPTTLKFYLVDIDGVVSQSPHIVSLSPIADQPPTVEAFLAGIGAAITPNAVLQVDGVIEDDYDVDAAWLEVETPVTDTLRSDVVLQSAGKFATQFDFQAMALAEDGFALPSSGGEISLVVKAADRFDLSDGVNIGIGDQYTLSIVSASELLQILEQLEVGQRKRLELIFNEVTDVREYLIRTRRDNHRPALQLQPGESQNPTPDLVGDSDDQRNELRKLFAQRAILQLDKSVQEIIGVAESFEDIRLQLINNRVDSEDREIRLAEKIVQPLRAIPAGVMTELRSTITELDAVIAPVMNDAENDRAVLLTESAIQITDKALIALDDVLSVLVKYETQNELLDIVRRMISTQEKLLEQTKKLRQREAFDDLFE